MPLGGILSGIGAKKRAKEERRFITEGAGELAPIAQQGQAAGNFLGSLLGLGGGGSAAPVSGATPGGGPSRADLVGFVAQNPDIQAEFNRVTQGGNKGLFGGFIGEEFDADGDNRLSPDEFARFHINTFGEDRGKEFLSRFNGGSSAKGAGAGASSAAEALQRFRESTGFRDTVNRAQRQTAASGAARGLLGSSGTGQVFQENAARLGRSSFSDFLDRLTQQQALGAQASGQRAGLLAGRPSARGSVLSGVGESTDRIIAAMLGAKTGAGT